MAASVSGSTGGGGEEALETLELRAVPVTRKAFAPYGQASLRTRGTHSLRCAVRARAHAPCAWQRRPRWRR
jgi:hypothetical protein